MTKTKIFTLLLVPVVLFLGYQLVMSVKGKIDLAADIERSEAKVIERLKLIREAEKAYFAAKGHYCGSWDSLINFVSTDYIYTVEKREIIIAGGSKNKKTPGADSVRIELDTIGRSLAHEVLFPKTQYPDLDYTQLAVIPGRTEKFDLYAGKTEKSKVTVDVVEVVDRYPLDRTRDDKNPTPKRWCLRFGSREEVTLSGNWE